MKTNSFLIISLLILLNACNRQTQSNTSTGENITDPNGVGLVVDQLGEHIWYIFQDTKNNYWFGSNGQGVYRYDGKNFVQFTTKDGLANDTIRQIQEDKQGNMYFSTFGGICKFDGQTISTLPVVKSTAWKLEENDMWFQMLGKKGEHGPYRYDGVNLYSLEFPKHFLHDEITAGGINPFFSPYEVYSIYKDRQGAMWFGTSVFGACRFDGQSIKWMYEKDLTISPITGGTFGIRSVFEDKSGDFWICSTTNRFKFDFEKTAQSDRLQYQKTAGIGNKEIFGGDEFVYFSHILEDSGGNIWLTTWDQGVFKYDGTTIVNYRVQDALKDVNLISMYKDRRGNLWLGTPDHGVFKFNGNAFERFKP